MATQAQKELYENKKAMYELWDQVINDFTIPENASKLAGLLTGSQLDVTSQESIDMLRKKNEATGEYELLGLQKVDPLTKEGIVDFLLRLAELMDDDSKIYNFNSLARDEMLPYYQRSVDQKGSISYGQMNEKIEKALPNNEPEPVAKPGRFRLWMNRWFGAFKSDVNKYNEYTQRLTEYHQTIDRQERDNTLRKRIVAENEEQLAKEKIAFEAKCDVEYEKRQNMTFEQKLMQEAELAEKKKVTYNMIAGRNEAVLGYHPNYKEINKIKLDVHPEVNMSGLALLFSCSERFNFGIRDQSSQTNIEAEPLEPLTDEEKGFMKLVEKANERSNIGGKIFESLYSGSDNDRMGNRMAAVIKARKATNEVVAQYLNGNKVPMAELINDCLDPLYLQICGMSSTVRSATGNATKEILDTLLDMLDNDPELNDMIGYSENRLQAMRGASRVYEFAIDSEQKKLEYYQSDKGPGTPEREDLLEKMLIEQIVTNIMIKEALKLDRDAGRFGLEKLNDPDITAIKNKWDEDALSVSVSLQTYFKEGYAQAPRIFHEFGKEGFDMEEFKRTMGSQIKGLPQFSELLNMEKDVLFDKDFRKLGDEFMSKMVLEEVKAKEGPDMVKQGQEAQMEQRISNPSAGLQ